MEKKATKRTNADHPTNTRIGEAKLVVEAEDVLAEAKDVVVDAVDAADAVIIRRKTRQKSYVLNAEKRVTTRT